MQTIKFIRNKYLVCTILACIIVMICAVLYYMKTQQKGKPFLPSPTGGKGEYYTPRNFRRLDNGNLLMWKEDDPVRPYYIKCRNTLNKEEQELCKQAYSVRPTSP